MTQQNYQAKISTKGQVKGRFLFLEYFSLEISLWKIVPFPFIPHVFSIKKQARVKEFDIAFKK